MAGTGEVKGARALGGCEACRKAVIPMVNAQLSSAGMSLIPLPSPPLHRGGMVAPRRLGLTCHHTAKRGPEQILGLADPAPPGLRRHKQGWDRASPIRDPAHRPPFGRMSGPHRHGGSKSDVTGGRHCPRSASRCVSSVWAGPAFPSQGVPATPSTGPAWAGPQSMVVFGPSEAKS
uniref:Uncharacterized protein n=1 Tax=Molossus molossus TaxID=27622 RepID=A0A7J8FYP4_MOLMO|nr:hypothetical protein HJG59_008157 [Molossus molossus]